MKIHSLEKCFQTTWSCKVFSTIRMIFGKRVENILSINIHQIETKEEE